MALTYKPSTEKIARSYQRTAQMVPNPGVSALSVVNGSVHIEPSMGAAATLSSPLAGMHLRRNSMSYAVKARRSRGGVRIRINHRSRRRLSRNVNYAIVSNRGSRRRLSRNVNYAIVSNRGSRRRLSRNVNYAIVSNRGSRRRLSRNVNYAIASNRRTSRRLHSSRRRHSRRLSRNVNYAVSSSRRRSRRRGGR